MPLKNCFDFIRCRKRINRKKVKDCLLSSEEVDSDFLPLLADRDISYVNINEQYNIFDHEKYDGVSLKKESLMHVEVVEKQYRLPFIIDPNIEKTNNVDLHNQEKLFTNMKKISSFDDNETEMSDINQNLLSMHFALYNSETKNVRSTENSNTVEDTSLIIPITEENNLSVDQSNYTRTMSSSTNSNDDTRNDILSSCNTISLYEQYYNSDDFSRIMSSISNEYDEILYFMYYALKYLNILCIIFQICLLFAFSFHYLLFYHRMILLYVTLLIPCMIVLSFLVFLYLYNSNFSRYYLRYISELLFVNIFCTVFLIFCLFLTNHYDLFFYY